MTEHETADARPQPIGLDACVQRGIYRIHSRNLRVGVYDGDEGFVGIREKFGSRYLFTEYHWDQGAPFGTVRPLELLGMLPDDIEVRENNDPVCAGCSQLVRFDRNDGEQTGRWSHLDGTDICAGRFPTSSPHMPLFDHLAGIEATLQS